MTKIKTKTRYFLELENRELPVDLKMDPDQLEYRILPNNYVVLGYLSQDEDCENPLENCDGMGHIYSSHRHASKDDHYKMQEALGLNQYWEKNLTGCDDEAKKRLWEQWQQEHPDVQDDQVYHAIYDYSPEWQEKIDALAEKIWEESRNPYAVSLDCYDHGGQVWAISGSAKSRNFPDQRWDVSHGAGVWVPDHACLEHIEYTAIKGMLPDGCEVEYRSEAPYGEDGKGYSNKTFYQLPNGESHECPDFVTGIKMAAQALGIEIDWGKFKERAVEEAYVCAGQALEEYNAWLSGECYGICMYVFDAKNNLVEDESCWGFIGTKYARKERQDWLDRLVEQYSNEKEYGTQETH